MWRFLLTLLRKREKKKKKSHDRSHDEIYNMITEVQLFRSLDSGPRGLDTVSPFLSSVKHYLIFCLRCPLSPCRADSSLFVLDRQADGQTPPPRVLPSSCHKLSAHRVHNNAVKKPGRSFRAIR